MKYLLIILLAFITLPQEKPDSCKTKLKKIKVQQENMNEKLDSLWIILKIDSTKRDK